MGGGVYTLTLLASFSFTTGGYEKQMTFSKARKNAHNGHFVHKKRNKRRCYIKCMKQHKKHHDTGIFSIPVN